MSKVIEYLKAHGLKNFSDKYHIKLCYHNTLPLVILNYNNILSPKNNDYVAICRGLVLEINTWKIISQGMIRFFNLVENMNNAIILGKTEIKEDGTLLHMFNYNGQWLLSTRHNFADDYMNYTKKLTYAQLFEQICGLNIQIVGSSLNPKYTYCLEMCSEENKIIRNYPKPIIYLLACFENGMELTSKEIDIEANKMGWSRPESYQISSILECHDLLNKLSLEDPLFEGLVIHDSNKKRYKMKNSFYLQIHKLKYRGWRIALGDTILPIIMNHQNKLDIIYQAITHNRPVNDLTEFMIRFDYYQKKLGENTNIKNILSHDKDPIIDHSHPTKYCMKEISKKYIDNGLAQTVPKMENGLWTVKCYCGDFMHLHRIKTDHLLYKICPHCDVKFDIHVYPVGTLIWLCGSNICQLTHDAHQNTMTIDKKNILKGQPTGIPCSSECKNLRLTIHQILAEIKEQRKCSRTDTYHLLASLLQIPIEDAHMALFDIPTCQKAIVLLQNEIQNKM